MARAKINKASIRKKAAGSKKLQERMDAAAQKVFDKARSKLINEFDQHPVTQELQGGTSGQNLTDSLGGEANLFTFLGFPSGTDPTSAVRRYISTVIKLRRTSRKRDLTVNYSVNLPSMDSFNFAKMPWESGNNWVKGIESGVSGFNYYLGKAAEASRSGKGIQIDGKVRARGSSSAVKYMSKLLADFRKRIKRI
jgi:hypothetical protein